MMKLRLSYADLAQLYTITCLIAFVLMVPAVLAEHPRHESHEHGVAHLNVAFEGHNLYIELISPAANIVGFEHHPRTAEQKSAVRKAIEALKATDPIFALSSDAGAKLVKSTVYTDIEEDHKHKSGEDHSPEHGETTRTDNHEEDDSYHGEHHDGDEHERHSEFKAEYHFVCSSPNNLMQIDVLLFRIFPGIEHIEVQLISGTRQTALELTANKSQIQF